MAPDWTWARKASPIHKAVLKPGSSHVMLIGLKKPLTASETIPLTLDFEKAGKVSITVPVRAMGAGHDDMPGMGHMDKK